MKKTEKPTVPNKLKLFDLENMDDLPEKLSNDIYRAARKPTIRSFALKLFDFKNVLTVQEIMVGLYRGHKIQKERHEIYALLASLVKKKYLKRIDVGTYERNFSE